MEKAYDLKALELKLKAKGLPEVEKLAEKSFEAFKEWFAESAVLSENKYDDVVVPFMTLVDGIVKPQLDKIDGVEG